MCITKVSIKSTWKSFIKKFHNKLDFFLKKKEISLWTHKTVAQPDYTIITCYQIGQLIGLSEASDCSPEHMDTSGKYTEAILGQGQIGESKHKKVPMFWQTFHVRVLPDHSHRCEDSQKNNLKVLPAMGTAVDCLPWARPEESHGPLTRCLSEQTHLANGLKPPTDCTKWQKDLYKKVLPFLEDFL